MTMEDMSCRASMGRPIARRCPQVHFTLHGCHHKFPLDRGRLVFPPLPALMCALGLRAACRAALPPVRSCPPTNVVGFELSTGSADCLKCVVSDTCRTDTVVPVPPLIGEQVTAQHRRKLLRGSPLPCVLSS